MCTGSGLYAEVINTAIRSPPYLFPPCASIPPPPLPLPHLLILEVVEVVFLRAVPCQ